MRGNLFLRILSAIILVALVVGAGVFVYNAGVAQWTGISGSLLLLRPVLPPLGFRTFRMAFPPPVRVPDLLGCSWPVLPRLAPSWTLDGLWFAQLRPARHSANG